MKAAVLIPCFNEIHTLEEVVARGRYSPVEDLENVVVDDCSTDGPRELLSMELESQVDRVICHYTGLELSSA